MPVPVISTQSNIMHLLPSIFGNVGASQLLGPPVMSKKEEMLII
jgi:hypothetical protein